MRPLRRDGQEFRHGQKGLILVGKRDPCFTDSEEGGEDDLELVETCIAPQRG